MNNIEELTQYLLEDLTSPEGSTSDSEVTTYEDNDFLLRGYPEDTVHIEGFLEVSQLAGHILHYYDLTPKE